MTEVEVEERVFGTKRRKKNEGDGIDESAGKETTSQNKVIDLERNIKNDEYE